MIRMSVSDPLIKDIKGCTLRLFNESIASPITDSNRNLHRFCQILENIFHKGFVGDKKTDVYTWMVSVASDHDPSSFAYKSCVLDVQNCKNVYTSIGKFRLLIRCCLAKRCLHLPLELVKDSAILYSKNSILGDDILFAIFLSVLLQCQKINFQLQLANSYFLDSSWQIPNMLKLELVPCKTLGISISFSDNKAIIVHIKSGSVTAETGEIHEGDMLANLNGVEINSSFKGRLNTILRLSKGRPVNLIIIKAFHEDSQDIFAPMKSVLQTLGMDLARIKNKESPDAMSKTCAEGSSKSGYKARYLGSVSVGNKGSVKQIEEAMKQRLTATKTAEKPVIFEIGEMSVKVFDLETNEIVLKHTYMQISSCGSAPNLSNYVAYIAGEKQCDMALCFTCYIFYVDSSEDAATILQSIGQGFYRTHFAV